MHLLDSSQNVCSRGVHGLAARDHHVHAQGLEDIRLARTCSYSHHAKVFGRSSSCGLALIGSDRSSAVFGLKVHVVNEDFEDLTLLEHMVQDLVGLVGVHVDLEVGEGAHQKLAVSHGREEVQVFFGVERLGVCMEEELGAIAVLRALPVIVELDVHVGSHSIFSRLFAGDGGVEVHRRVDAQVGVDKGFEEDGKAKGAGVYHAVLFEHRKQVRGAGHRLIGAGHHGLQGLVQSHLAVAGKLVCTLGKV